MSVVLGFAAYLLFAPMFVLPALALLLVVSGPSTMREWWWIAASALWLAYTGTRDLGLYQISLLAAGIMMAGAFVGLILQGPRPVFRAAILATVAGMIGLLAWGAVFGIGWGDLRHDFLRQQWEFATRFLIHPEYEDGGIAAAPWVREYGEQFARSITPLAVILPAVTALMALGGLAMSWSWYRRISHRPLGQPLGRLADFRFSDQMVWGVIAGLGLLLVPAIGSLRELGGNLLLFFGGLFALRGLAVTRTWLTQAPGTLIVFMALSLLFIAPVAVGGLLSLGLADIWLDFRRRMMPPTVEG